MKTLIPTAALLALALAAPAAATGTVRIADLDLNSANGQAELTKRIDIAANQICTLFHETGTIIRKTMPNKACMTDAREQITAQVQKLAIRTGMTSEQLARK